ncbi:MAG: hypothetical protein MJH10_12500 [Epibacterium sp.]|nr:hypothetical protein [Epibacterium sp.]NQX74365.1 hypothetical protein [Epibacterium sp.]
MLGKITSTGTDTELLYTVPATTRTVVNVAATNTGGNAAQIKIHVHPSGDAAADGNAIELLELDPGAVLERTGLVLDAGDQVSVWSDQATVSFHAFGVESAVI